MRMINADDLEQALRDIGMLDVIKGDCKFTSAWGVPIVDAIPLDEFEDKLKKICDIICPYSKKQRDVMCGACALGTAYDLIEQYRS